MQTHPVPIQLHLFQGYGVELEYMVVDKNSLKVQPITDQILKAFSGEYIDEIENGEISWSNELALHVIELKTNGPAKSLENLSGLFAENVKQINKILEPLNALLLPAAMHPFIDPFTEMKLWPHQRNEIYEKYNEIFDCRGHGWANLQSVHLNLPFHGDVEFGKLHAAIRLVLPILPALAASSPIKDSNYSGFKDTRLDVYQYNQKRVPSICGKVIPEAVYTKKDYEEQILQKNYSDIAPYDPQGILQDEWLNSRGAIARFQRNAIEIRVLDIQECPAADMAVLKVVISTIKHLVNEQWTKLEDQKLWPVDSLVSVLKQCIKDGEEANIINPDYLSIFGFRRASASASELWQHLIHQTEQLTSEEKQILSIIIKEGSLSTRISKAIGAVPSMDKMVRVYKRLADCLAANKPFTLKFEENNI